MYCNTGSLKMHFQSVLNQWLFFTIYQEVSIHLLILIGSEVSSTIQAWYLTKLSQEMLINRFFKAKIQD